MLANEHDERQRPAGRRPEEHDALHDGVGLGAGGGGRRQHRQEVRRDVADRRGDQERPGALQAVRLAEARAPRRSAGSALRRAPGAGRESRPQASQLCRPCCIAVTAAALTTSPRQPVSAARRRARPSPPTRSAPTPRAGRSSPACAASRKTSAAEREQRQSRDDRRVVGDLDQRDQHAEHHDLDHAPGARGRVMAQQRPDPARRHGSRRAPSTIASMKPICSAGAIDGGEEHQHGDDLPPVVPELLRRRRPPWWRPRARRP